MASDDTKIAPQVSLGGYHAWVVEGLRKTQGVKAQEVIRTMIREWIEGKAKDLDEVYDLSLERYRRERNIIPHPSSKGVS